MTTWYTKPAREAVAPGRDEDAPTWLIAANSDYYPGFPTVRSQGAYGRTGKQNSFSEWQMIKPDWRRIRTAIDLDRKRPVHRASKRRYRLLPPLEICVYPQRNGRRLSLLVKQAGARPGKSFIGICEKRELGHFQRIRWPNWNRARSPLPPLHGRRPVRTDPGPVGQVDLKVADSTTPFPKMPKAFSQGSQLCHAVTHGKQRQRQEGSQEGAETQAQTRTRPKARSIHSGTAEVEREPIVDFAAPAMAAKESPPASGGLSCVPNR